MLDDCEHAFVGAVLIAQRKVLNQYEATFHPYPELRFDVYIEEKYFQKLLQALFSGEGKF